VSEARRGATVLFSSHQLGLVEHLCEDAVIVDRGRAVAHGPLDDLTAGHDPVLLVDVPGDREATWTAALDPTRFIVLSSANGAVRISVVDGPEPAIDRAQPALDAARTAGAVNRFGFERRTLAEVFLEIVGRPPDQPDEVAGEAGSDGEPGPASVTTDPPTGSKPMESPPVESESRR